MDDKPLEILPWGRTKADQDKLDRTKAQGRRGLQGCLLMAVMITLAIVYIAGWMAGRHGS